MKLLLVYEHYPVCLGRYITDAFQRLGVDVRHVGYQRSLANTGWGVDVDAKYNWIPDGDLRAFWEDWTPAAIVLCDTALVGWRHWRYTDVPMVCWTVDNHVRNIRQDGVLHYFLAHYHGQAQPVKEQDESWLPCAFDPEAFQPSQIEWNEREYDVCLVGVQYPRRQRLVSMLRSAGLKVFAGTGLVYDEYQAAYANSRISLCVSANDDLAQRVFETAAIGCHVLTDRVADLADDYTNGKLKLSGFSVYTDDERCVERAKALITTDAAEAQGATYALQQIVWQKHKWDDRAAIVLNWLKAHKIGILSAAVEDKPKTLQNELNEAINEGIRDIVEVNEKVVQVIADNGLSTANIAENMSKSIGETASLTYWLAIDACGITKFMSINEYDTIAYCENAAEHLEVKSLKIG